MGRILRGVQGPGQWGVDPYEHLGRKANTLKVLL